MTSPTANSVPGMHNRSTSGRKTRWQPGCEEPPLYSIDLSIPPESRYAQICNDYKDEMAELAKIYDELLSSTPFPRFFGFLARNLLKKVYSKEETKEIRGISKATRIPVHLVVAYNTFLDLFSGCISGGTQTRLGSRSTTSMLHFRGLDWEMEPLRDMVIRAEYLVNGKVVARAVTYAGYLGALTGVREGLSISLNYRARLNSVSSTFQNRLHHILLLLGLKPSIASQLRQILLSPEPVPTLQELTSTFKKIKTSSCYLTFCTPSEVLIVEKDLKTAITRSSNQFLAVTNHDIDMEQWTPEYWREMLAKERILEISGARGIVEESMERKECLCQMWRMKGAEPVSVDDLKLWLRKYPVRNETTHFSCIMDPSVKGGGLVWVEACDAPDSQ